MQQVSGCLLRIQLRYSSLRSSEQRVGDWILQHPHEAIRMSITELARQVGVSESTVARFCRSLEFSGYQEMKIALAQELIPAEKQVHEQVEPTDDESAIIQKVCQANANVALATQQVLDPVQLSRAVDAVERARVVTLLGMGVSGAVAADLQSRLLRLGIVSRMFTDSHLQIMSTAVPMAGHVVIGITASGRSRSIVDAMAAARKAGATTIAITSQLDSPVCQHSDIILHALPGGEWLAGVASHSRLSQLCVVDALYVALALRDKGRLAHNLLITKTALVTKHVN